MKCPHCGKDIVLELAVKLLGNGIESAVLRSKKAPKSGAQRTRESRARKKDLRAGL